MALDDNLNNDHLKADSTNTSTKAARTTFLHKVKMGGILVGAFGACFGVQALIGTLANQKYKSDKALVPQVIKAYQAAEEIPYTGYKIDGKQFFGYINSRDDRLHVTYNMERIDIAKVRAHNELVKFHSDFWKIRTYTRPELNIHPDEKYPETTYTESVTDMRHDGLDASDFYQRLRFDSKGVTIEKNCFVSDIDKSELDRLMTHYSAIILKTASDADELKKIDKEKLMERLNVEK